MDDICQWNVDIQSFLSTVLNAMQQIHDAGLPKVCKTLLILILLHYNEMYVRSFDALRDLLDSDDVTCWVVACLLMMLECQSHHGTKSYTLLFIWDMLI